MSDNKKVEAEIQSFLEALASYPERFARDPRVTFEQHLANATVAPSALASSPVVEPVLTRDKRARSAAASS